MRDRQLPIAAMSEATSTPEFILDCFLLATLGHASGNAGRVMTTAWIEEMAFFCIARLTSRRLTIAFSRFRQKALPISRIYDGHPAGQAIESGMQID